MVGRQTLPRRCKRRAVDGAGAAPQRGGAQAKGKVKRLRSAKATITSRAAPAPEQTRDRGSCCSWVKCEVTRQYHDEVWGTPLRYDQSLFEMLSLCSQQAGVSWRVVWNKRDAYRQAFHDWDMQKIAAMTDRDVEDLIQDANNGIMHNRAKLRAIVNNAKVCLELRECFPGGLSGFLWSFTDGATVVNDAVRHAGHSLASESDTSKAMSKAFKSKGFKFLGSITLHAFCQQVGILNDHCRACFRNPLSKE